MAKSVYSLVLSDEVIREIDQLAYRNQTNRSNMVNQILAEYVSVPTPEKRMQEIFNRMEALLLGTGVENDAFQLQSLPSETMFSLRSAIAYKYNPSVRYSVELYKQRDDDGAFGELRVGLRTQNQALIQCMSEFYNLWNSTECQYFEDIDAAADGEKYVRKLKLKTTDGTGEKLSGLTVGDVISTYIRTFDRALKAYFERVGSGRDTGAPIDAVYQQYLKGEVFV